MIGLRLAHVSDLDGANAFLPSFIPRFNERFAVEPADPETAFRPAPSPGELARIACFKEERKASNGSTISFLGNTYRLIDERGDIALLCPRSKVIVLTHLDGSLGALYQDRPCSLEVCCKQPKVSEKQVPIKQEQVKPKPNNNANSPWRKYPHVQRKPTDPVELYLRDRAFWKTIDRQST